MLSLKPRDDFVSLKVPCMVPLLVPFGFRVTRPVTQLRERDAYLRHPRAGSDSRDVEGPYVCVGEHHRFARESLGRYEGRGLERVCR